MCNICNLHLCLCVFALLCIWKTSNGQNIFSGGANQLPEGKCGQTSSADRVFGGVEAPLDASPWMVLIEYEDRLRGGFKPFCGGSIINAKYVLTAAHCITGNSLTYSPPSRVRLGEHDLSTLVDCRGTDEGEMDCNDPPVFIQVESYVSHPQYVQSNKSQHNDIALLRLAKAIKWTDFIKPVCLPAAMDTPKSPTEVFFSGWGKTEKGTNSDVKLEGKSYVVLPDYCQYAYDKWNVSIFEGQICAGGEDGVDTCRGDSGGPLTAYSNSAVSWRVVGIVSFGPSRCGTKGVPGVYTNVPYYVDWIKSQLRP